MCLCACVCMRVCVCACVRACVRASVCENQDRLLRIIEQLDRCQDARQLQ